MDIHHYNVVSAQGNNGVWLGSPCYLIPSELKYLLVGNMWIGRLEIIPVLVLLKAIYESFKRANKQIHKGLKQKI